MKDLKRHHGGHSQASCNMSSHYDRQTLPIFSFISSSCLLHALVVMHSGLLPLKMHAESIVKWCALDSYVLMNDQINYQFKISLLILNMDSHVHMYANASIYISTFYLSIYLSPHLSTNTRIWIIWLPHFLTRLFYVDNIFRLLLLLITLVCK